MQLWKWQDLKNNTKKGDLTLQEKKSLKKSKKDIDKTRRSDYTI